MKVSRFLKYSQLIKRGSITGYLVTVLLVALALWIRLAIAPVNAGIQYVTFFPAVTLAAFIGGYRAGILATLAGLVFATFIFTSPYYAISLDVLKTSIWSNLVFLMDGLIVSFAIESMHRFREQFQQKLQLSISSNAALVESELRWKFAIQGAGGGLWDWDIERAKVFYSPFWKQMIGQADNEVGTGLDEWESRVHPEDKASTLVELQKCLDGNSQFYMSEHRFRCKDGSYKWMFDRGMVVSRGEDGKPLRMVGMHFDITDRKQTDLLLQQSEEKLRAITDNVSIVMFLKDLNGHYLFVNRQYEKLFHVFNEGIQGKTDYDMFPRDMADAFVNNDQAVIKSGKPIEIEELVQHDDGIHTYFSVKIPVRNASGEIYAICGIATDITERKHADDDLRIAAAAFDSQEGMMVTDSQSVILRVNRAFSEITGYTAEEAVGQTPRFLQSGRHDKAFYEEMWDAIKKTGGWQGEVWDKRKNGEVYPKWLTVSAVKDHKGAVTHYVGSHYDISDRKMAEEKIAELAFYDPLTHLPNRTLLRDRLMQAMMTGNRNKTFGSVIFIDLDNFKTLNDTMGHDSGDQFLVEVAQRICGSVREGDTVARLGGDEFVVVLKNLSTNAQEAAQLTEGVGLKILAGLNQVFQLGDFSHRSSASIGATLFSGNQLSVEELLKQADLAMYKSKEAGRNTMRFFDVNMELAVMKRAALENDLHNAVSHNQLLLHYQAQMSEGQLTGVEVLVRWQHPQRGLVSPDEFIPLAEETGLILPLGEWVLKTACRQLSIWAARPEMAQLTISVNVSTRQFHQPDFVDQVLEILKNTGAPPRKLKLEMTESLLVSDIDMVIEKMFALKAKGVCFSLDDFGTGFSSLSYLKRLPLDQLKIDKSFVQDVLIDPNDAAIAKTIIALAQTLGLGIIAEGVETEAQRDFLVHAGCHSYQGYYFSKPLPLDKFEEYTRNNLLCEAL
jgi:diguanylate cyclase (GGDEF)-like protein/PAS domain S-box-containing protein